MLVRLVVLSLFVAILVLVITSFIVVACRCSDVVDDDGVEAKATASTTEGGNDLVEAVDENRRDEELTADDGERDGFEIVAKGDGNDGENNTNEANNAEDSGVGLEEAGSAESGVAEASEVHTVSLLVVNGRYC